MPDAPARDAAPTDATPRDPEVHPTSFVDPAAELAPGVRVGPYCVVEGPVRLAENARLVSHCCLYGPVEVGPGSSVWPFAVVGAPPLHAQPSPGTPRGVKIGANATVREHATVHAAWEDDGLTEIGDGSLVMVGAHVGHDVKIGDRVVLANSCQIAGHASVGDDAYVSGNVVVHQFVRLGRLTMMSGGSATSSDIPPFCMASGRNVMIGVNAVGMRRAGIPREDITAVRRAYRETFGKGTPVAETNRVLAEIAETSPAVREIAEFVASTSRRICHGDGRPPANFIAWLRRWADRRAAGEPEPEADELD